MTGALDPRSAMHASARAAGPRLRVVPPAAQQLAFGPQHHTVAALIRALGHISPEQDDAIEANWYERRGAHRFAARGQASSAASRHSRLEAQLNARQQAWSASSLKCRDAAGDAAHALAVRDLIGQGFTREAYDELVAPCASVLGPLHPDDG